MSYGERSCQSYGSCKIETRTSCTVNCKLYKSNGKQPDTGKLKPDYSAIMIKSVIDKIVGA